MSKKTIIADTSSVCPHCLRVLDGELVRGVQGIYLQKRCPQHGEFSTLVWADGLDFEAWGGRSAAGGGGATSTRQQAPCPGGCLSCSEHKTRPCCVLFELTKRCNLNCPVCFADAGSADGTQNTSQSTSQNTSVTPQTNSTDPTLDTIASWYDSLKQRAGICNIQLSGGEPTLRDDLVQIIQIGKQKGFGYFQLNTNGLRLASQPELAASLKKAGLSCVFLQFDGFKAATNKALRGRQLIGEKIAAIQNCVAVQLPIVLVPTLAKGINDDELMTIIEFGMKHSPSVRGVHIQPLSGFGRCGIDAQSARMTIPEVLVALEQQSDGMLKRQHFSGGSAENPYCSFNANYLIGANDKLEHLGGASTTNNASCCSTAASVCYADTVAIAQDIQKRRWAPDLRATDPDARSMPKPGSLDDWLAGGKTMNFSITGMAFMDTYSLDFERLRSCYIFVMSNGGQPVPFCAYNLTNAEGRGFYR